MSAARRTHRRWSLRSVRARTTILAVVVVGIALVIAGTGLLVAVRSAEVDRVRTSAESRAADIAGAIDAGLPPADLALDEGSDRFVQVVVDGTVVAASRTVANAAPLVDRAGATRSLTLDGEADDDWVVATTASSDGALVVVGRELDGPRETAGTIAALLIGGIPLLLVVVGATTWFVAGRALAPVEAIRREADEIGAADLGRRVPEPSSDDEVARLAVTVNGMLGRLQDGQARQRRFISDASHELRAPVAVIRQQAELAELHPERTSLAEVSAAVLGESDRLAALVDDLLVLARSDEGAVLESDGAVDLDDLALDAARRVRADITVDATAVSGAQVRGDRRLLARVVGNLVDNAATHARSRVVLALGDEGDGAVLTVADDGPGIPPEDRERVFERFVRLDEARTRDAGGSGLGLAIVDAVVRAHGGTVAIDDAPGGGTSVTVRLPSTTAGGSTPRAPAVTTPTGARLQSRTATTRGGSR